MLSDSGERVCIHFDNTTWEETGDSQILAYRPGELLVIGSWPEAVSPAVARLAVARSFPTLAAQGSLPELRRMANPVTRSYVVRCSATGELKLIERHFHFHQPKYRSGQKFSHAFKPRITRIDERVLLVPGHVQPDEKLAGREIVA